MKVFDEELCGFHVDYNVKSTKKDKTRNNVPITLTWESPEIKNLINDKKTNFTPKEFDLLIHLFNHPIPNSYRKNVC